MSFNIVQCIVTPNKDSSFIDEVSLYRLFSTFVSVFNIRITENHSSIKAFLQIKGNSLKTFIDNFHGRDTPIGYVLITEYNKKDVVFDMDLRSILGLCLNKQPEFNQREKRNFKDRGLIFYINAYDPIINDRKVSDHKLELLKDSYDQKRKYTITNVSIRNEERTQNFGDSIQNPLLNYNFNRAASIQDTYLLNTKNTLFYVDSSSYSNFFKEKEDKNIFNTLFSKTGKRFLFLNDIFTSNIICSIFSNLIGCFTNVKEVVIFKNQNKGFIEVESHSQAKRALRYLRSIPIFGKPLDMELLDSNLTMARINNFQIKQNIEILTLKDKLHRFKQGFNIKVNKPSKFIHITALPLCFDLYSIYKLIKDIHEPLRILKLQKNGKSSNMYHVEFGNISQAAETLALLHNTRINDKLVKVSFSHPEADGKNAK